MQRAGVKKEGVPEWEQRHAPRESHGGSSHHTATAPVIVAESRQFVEPNRAGTLGVAQEIQARRQAMAELLEQYGDRPIPERVYRARGLGLFRNPKSRRHHVRESTILATIRRLDRQGVGYGCGDLAEILGMQGPRCAQRVRATVKGLIRAGRCEPGTAGVGRVP